MNKPFDYQKADKSGVSFGSSWGTMVDGKLANVVDERTVPSVINRLIEESKTHPDTLFVLGRLIYDGFTLEEVFLEKESWTLIQNGKIAIIGAPYLDRYSPKLGLPSEENWVLLSDREEAYHQYVILKKF